LTDPAPSIPPPAPADLAAARWLDERDDVATALAALPRGTRVALACGAARREVVLHDDIAAGHKFALAALAAGAPIRKYGELIGFLTAGVEPGDWVHEHNLATSAHGPTGGDAAQRAQRARDAAPASTRENAAIATKPPAGGPSRAPRASSIARHPDHFLGYRRPDGRAGVRNHVLVLSPTGLTSAAAARVAGLVHGTLAVTSGYGRGQVSADADLQFRTLAGLAANPNVAGVVVMSAADEISQSYADAIAPSGKPVVALSLPGVHEDALTLVDRGVRAAARLVAGASALRRERADLAQLCIAVECGHSDASSGILCNPLAGRMMELVVAGGGQAMFSETVEWTGAEHLLAQRAVDADVAARIVAAVAAREARVRESGGDIRAQNPGPQNKAGGLTTIEEKALGAIAKGGRQPIHGVLAAAERPRGAGLFLMDTPYFSPESMTAMVAGGAQVVVFTTGAGNSYCSAIAPTMKISANPRSVAQLTEQIDFDASGDDREARAQDGVARLLDIASGSLTFGEIVGEGAEVVSRLGPSL
jgi:altronate dehydratase large subunit